jgi:hypothetical protein
MQYTMSASNQAHDPVVIGKGNLEEIAATVPKTKKLHGRAFYESIGSPKFVLAPMVDQSEYVIGSRTF